MKNILLVFTILIMHIKNFAQQIIPLYNGAVINNKTNSVKEITEKKDNLIFISKISNPTLTVFLPPVKTANGTAVIICPGGGYSLVSYGHEGVDVALAFNKVGIAAFVLKYRLPDDSIMIDKEKGTFQDGQQAIKLVRENAIKWNINPDKVGMLGFSAGGHLVSTIGTHLNIPLIPNDQKTNLRPDFMILIYPVISLVPGVGYAGCAEKLFGSNATSEKINFYSGELQVTKQTPPSFLVHASDDNAVKPDNSILFYQALLKNNVPAELHLYQTGGHGKGMALPTMTESWLPACIDWMKRNGWLKK
jgi:acetyl esterase/lipase